MLHNLLDTQLPALLQKLFEGGEALATDDPDYLSAMPSPVHFVGKEHLTRRNFFTHDIVKAHAGTMHMCLPRHCMQASLCSL